MKIKIFSFFSGLGLLDLGFEDAGYEIVEVFEKDKDFINMYKYSRNKLSTKEPVYGYKNIDVENLLTDKEFEKRVIKESKCGVVGFIGGPPCPDFSIAGKNKGHKGDNGRLTSIYFELIKKYKPDFFLFENVKGIWKTKKNREYITKQLKETEKCGYVIDSKVLNALNFGVPQDRERFISIGFKNEMKILPSTVFSDFNYSDIKNEYDWPLTDIFIENENLRIKNNILRELTVQYWFEKNSVANHYNADDYFKPRSLEKFETIAEGDVSKKSFKRLHRWRYSPTVAYGNNEVHLHPFLKRRLSVSEALALQSAPIGLELPKDISLTKKFKTIGNSVPYNMAFKIAVELKRTMERKDNSVL